MTVENQELDTSVEHAQTTEHDMSAMSDTEFLDYGAKLEAGQIADTQAVESESVATESEPLTDTSLEVENPEPQETEANTDNADKPVGEEASNGEEVSELAPPVEQVNYEEFHKLLTTPFKANGRDLHVTNPEDMIHLMQKGADYVKKMTEIKPLRRIGKLLEEHQLGEEDIAYLIDLKNKKPEAIAKLVKDSEIDIYGLDLEQGDSYSVVVPQVAEVNDVLQSTLDDLQATSATFSQTISVVGNQWDSASRDVISKNPHLLRILDQQVANGTFAQIDGIVQYERALGRLADVSDIQAYVEVERRLGIGSQSQQPQQQPIPQTQPLTNTPPEPNPAQVQQLTQQQKLVEQRKQAAPPRQTTTQTQTHINPATMNDAEFLKFMASQGL